MLDNVGLDGQREGAYMPGQSDDVREFLQRRRDEFVEKEKTLKAELVTVQTAIQNLDAALAILTTGPTAPVAGEVPRLTIKEAVMRILTPLAPRGLSALSILERLRTDFGMDYQRESLSPQLSRLKAEGRLRLEGGIWFSTEKETAQEPSS
jgi:hypothetical protein